MPRIVGRDDGGRFQYEYVEVPDHQVRINAAKALLGKRIPDLARTTEVQQTRDRTYVISITPEHARKIREAAAKTTKNNELSSE